MPAYKDEKTGKWFAKFYYTNWQGIKKQKWKRGFATKKEALGFERDFLEKQSANPDMTFQNLYEIYMEDMAARLKQSTLLTKKAVLQTHILPFFGSKPINEIKASDVRRWQAKLMSSPNNYSQTYLKKINTELNSIINYAKRFYDLNTNPCGKAGTIGKAKAEEMDYWTYNEYIAFREGVKDKPLSYICFEVLYWTGMREGELLALSPADIDIDNKLISINRTYQRIGGKDVFTSPKTRKSKRKIPIPDFLCQELSDYIQSRYMLDADERLFPVTKSYLSHEMIRGCKNTGVKKIRIHDIRHPYVKHTTKIFSLRLMDSQAQAYPDARRKIRGACQLHRGGQSRIPVRPFCNRKQFPCLPPQAKMSWILYAISMRLSGYTSTRSISSSASSVVSVSASKIALDASLRLSCRTCSSCFCFACANTAA